MIVDRVPEARANIVCLGQTTIVRGETSVKQLYIFQCMLPFFHGMRKEREKTSNKLIHNENLGKSTVICFRKKIVDSRYSPLPNVPANRNESIRGEERCRKEGKRRRPQKERE